MKKYENFINCLTVLKKADFNKAVDDEIYRTGIIAQFNLTFELAWKALQETLRFHSVSEAEIGSPREILKIGFSKGFVSDSEIWLLMLRKRNTSVHIYNENDAFIFTYLAMNASKTTSCLLFFYCKFFVQALNRFF